MKPTVSIVMPAFKAADFIGRAIESVQAQTLKDFELLVIDDASPDDTVKVVERFAKADKRIKLLKQKVNVGPSVARNRGFAEANGRWIAILDADDAYEPNRLKNMVLLAEEQGLDILGDNVWIYDAFFGKKVRRGFKERKPYRPWGLLEHFRYDIPHTPFVYGWLKPLFRREFVEKSGLSYRHEFRYAEDYLFYAELLLAGAKALIVSEPYYIYTTRTSEITGKESGQSRTPAHPKELLRGARWLRETYAGRIPAKVMPWVLRRERAIAAYEDFGTFRGLLGRGKKGQALAFLLRTPRLWGFMARVVKQKIERKLGLLG